MATALAPAERGVTDKTVSPNFCQQMRRQATASAASTATERRRGSSSMQGTIAAPRRAPHAVTHQQSARASGKATAIRIVWSGFKVLQTRGQAADNDPPQHCSMQHRQQSESSLYAGEAVWLRREHKMHCTATWCHGQHATLALVHCVHDRRLDGVRGSRR